MVSSPGVCAHAQRGLSGFTGKSMLREFAVLFASEFAGCRLCNHYFVHGGDSLLHNVSVDLPLSTLNARWQRQPDYRLRHVVPHVPLLMHRRLERLAQQITACTLSVEEWLYVFLTLHAAKPRLLRAFFGATFHYLFVQTAFRKAVRKRW